MSIADKKMPEFKQFLDKKYSKPTAHNVFRNVKHFREYYPKRAEKAEYQDVIKYIAYLRKNTDLHPKTLIHCLFSIKVYFNWLLETGRRKDHPCSELYLKDKINKQIQVENLYSEETLQQFFEYEHKTRRKPYLDRRNKIIVSLLVFQALNVTELVNIELKDVDLTNGEIFIKANHHQQSRTLPLKANQIMLIYNYLNEDRPKLLEFGSSYKKAHELFIIGQFGRRIHASNVGYIINENRPEHDHLSPMKIRQSVIANLLKKEHDTRIVQVFAGHKQASTTEQYKQNALETLQSAINQYHPLLKMKNVE